jgi:hypothetical protein
VRELEQIGAGAPSARPRSLSDLFHACASLALDPRKNNLSLLNLIQTDKA